MTTALLMADVSSIQGRIDVAALHRAGYRSIAVKATEGDRYVNPFYAETVDAAHRLGMTVVHYHFATATADGDVQAAHFLSVVKPHCRTRRDWLAVDSEGQPSSYRQWAPGQARKVATAFLRVVWNRGPRVGLLHRRVRRLVYGPPYFLRDSGVRPGHGEGLWLADYDGDPTVLDGMGWKTWTVWQFTDKATVPGIGGPVDESHIRPGVTSLLGQYPTLHFGDKGQAVRLLQHLLRAHGHLDVDVTGIFETHTRSAVRAVKTAHGWKADGIAGPRVWRVLTR